jgi:hypothetical protein
MTQVLAQDWILPGRRRVGAFLLAVCLNLALLPCAMALEVEEQGHDCCPPEIQLEAAECCQLDDVSVDARTGMLELFDSPDLVALPAPSFYQVLAAARTRYAASAQPPDPPDEFPPLYDLYCVYLK